MSYVIVGYNWESYCHALRILYCLPTSMYGIVENKFKTRFFSVSLSFSLSGPFIVDRASQRDRQYDSWLCVKYTHTRTCSHCIPRCSSMCVYLCTHLHMHNRHPIVFTSVMNSTVLLTASYRPTPLPGRFLEKFTLRQPTDETLYACQIFNGAGTLALRQYCRLLRGERLFRQEKYESQQPVLCSGDNDVETATRNLKRLTESECESKVPDDNLYCLSFNSVIPDNTW